MVTYGGFWERFAAWLIDAVIMAVLGGIVGAVFGGLVGGMMFAGGSTDVNEASILASLGGNVIGIVLNWLYYAIMESSSRQATIGKLALGLVVTDEQGYPISFGRATGRYFAKYISTLILLFGFFMVGWTQRKQGLHDIIASTLVMRKGSMANTASADVFR